MDEIQGMISEVVFRNEVNGYTVLELQDDVEENTVVGYFPYVNIGETIKAVGTWVEHPDYGRQFKMETYQVVTPATLNGIERYLSSGLIPGIGAATAKKMVEKFGLDTLDIIQYNPQRLTEIDGIGQKKAQKIYEAFQEQRELKDIMLFLESYNISPAYAVRIYKTYGANTIKVIRENPYNLADDVFGIGFKMADRIAQSMGIPLDSEYRIASGTRYVLSQFHNNGHSYIPQDKLIKTAAELLDVREEAVENMLMGLYIDRKIVVDDLDGVKAVYSIAFYKAEVGVARRLLALAQYPVFEVNFDIEHEINQIEKEEGICLATNQKEAVEKAVTKGLLVVTGGPGTGKTTTIKAIIRLFERMGLSVLLCAPTGRAAKRMQEATGRESKTIHRLLEYGYGDRDEDMMFQRNEDSPLEANVVIVDEVSMVDILLMNNLLKAISEGTRLILVGDVDQLPSVGPGCVLRDIINSEAVTVVRLNEIFRQAQESLIVVNAHRINKGEAPILNIKNKDFFFMREESQTGILEKIKELCKDRLPKYSGYSSIEGIQVLSPMKKGICGVINLNTELQKILNPPHPTKNERQYRDMIFREGDKVMQIRNNYKMKWQSLWDSDYEGEGVFNGDMGIISKVDNEEQTVEVIFDGERLVRYEPSDLDELELAYAVTVHKSQGSEFPVLVMPVIAGPPMLLTRNLLYTALTRAKKMVVLVGQERCIYSMINNNYVTRRYSGLEYRLRRLGNWDEFMGNTISIQE
ncbi:SF1B family DNA helicase RecD2 [Lutispora thermophila]|uniref:ATP-dependent RecD2 DNA helicase n=1 Tax=Lutispora thermophila DSM 19022 TaxID=1122184 RepID=A0A1M6AQ56_9FIRM|nr:ATP-dependent RecD-like DNA helicase [Lutispora thermophila]SHI38468.1 ATP-dependent DNA helicase, RecD/TraA family [Lutispora thermophila DSM 19022]